MFNIPRLTDDKNILLKVLKSKIIALYQACPWEACDDHVPVYDHLKLPRLAKSDRLELRISVAFIWISLIKNWSIELKHVDH